MSATITSKCHPCSVCEGLDHHWLEECDDDHPQGIMACKHCPATRAIVDADYETDERGSDDYMIDDPNQCSECGDNLDEFDNCVHCDY